MALRPGRYIAHFLGLASDGKPIYAAYCCVPDTQSDSDLPSFVSVSDSTSDSGSWGSYPQSSYPDSGGSAPSSGGGGISCSDCLARLCVVRDQTGRIVDIYYYTDSGDYVRVLDCGYYRSEPSSASEPSSDGGGDSGGDSGGSGGGGSNNLCCPPPNSQYVIDYYLTIDEDSYSGSVQGSWFGNIFYAYARHSSQLCLFDLNINFSFVCNTLGPLGSIEFVCMGTTICNLQIIGDTQVTISNCPNLPTFYVSILPGRCASGSFVLRPA
jgi:hypothetical protein